MSRASPNYSDLSPVVDSRWGSIPPILARIDENSIPERFPEIIFQEYFREYDISANSQIPQWPFLFN